MSFVDRRNTCILFQNVLHTQRALPRSRIWPPHGRHLRNRPSDCDVVCLSLKSGTVGVIG